MSRFYKNTLRYGKESNPVERREEISENIAQYADFLPKTLSYEDIDKSFKQWVEDFIMIRQDDIVLPTLSLFSNQRFSEYIQSWKYTDENNNVRLNFKTVTRENNPQHGTILGHTYNIMGDRYYTIKSIETYDDNGKRYRLDYKMKQPTPVDLLYRVSIFTNKYTSINDFNETIHRLFNARQHYISPNGHYMSLLLESISDESEYNIQDRQFFSQSFSVRVMGYIIKEDDYIIEENPIATIVCFEGDDAKRKKATIELIEDEPCYIEEEEVYIKDIEIDIDLSYCSPCDGKIKFTMDEEFILTGMEFKEPLNIVENEIILYINDTEITTNLLSMAFEGYKQCDIIPDDITDDNTIYYNELPDKLEKDYKYVCVNDIFYQWHQITFHEDDEIRIKTRRKNRYNKTGGLILKGYNKTSDNNENMTISSECL